MSVMHDTLSRMHDSAETAALTGGARQRARKHGSGQRVLAVELAGDRHYNCRFAYVESNHSSTS
jgi:hypothetical protein